MPDNIVLVGETGRAEGSRSSTRLRAEGRIPGVMYGKTTAPTSVTVEWSALRAALTTEAGLNALIELEVEGERHLTIVKELQRNPVRRTVDHVDFLAIERGVEIEVTVPIETFGEAKQVIDEGGVVDQTMHEIQVFSIPANIPNKLEVDISGLTLAEPVRVSDLTLPEGVRTEVDPEDPIVTANIPSAEPEPIDETLEGLEEGEEPEEGADDAEASADDGGDSEGGDE